MRCYQHQLICQDPIPDRAIEKQARQLQRHATYHICCWDVVISTRFTLIAQSGVTCSSSYCECDNCADSLAAKQAASQRLGAHYPGQTGLPWVQHAANLPLWERRSLRRNCCPSPGEVPETRSRVSAPSAPHATPYGCESVCGCMFARHEAPANCQSSGQARFHSMRPHSGANKHSQLWLRFIYSLCPKLRRRRSLSKLGHSQTAWQQNA
jgi:hypothetical protein